MKMDIYKTFPLWRLRTLRRKVWEALGSRRYSIPCPKSILNAIQKYCASPGFFIEVGAFDGVIESNTYFLERFEGWTGILIEPLPDMFARLKSNRPRSIHFNSALVGHDFEGKTLTIRKDYTMSQVVANGATSMGEASCVDVPARTLSSILDEVKSERIDLLSLDVEGYEIDALRGLDFRRHRPRFMLIECLTNDAREAMDHYLSGEYDFVEQLTHRDFLYRSATLS